MIEDGKEYISLQSATLSALSSVKNAQSLIVVEQDKLKAAKMEEIEQTKLWETQLKTAMNEASGMIENYKSQIVDLRNQMSSLNLYIDDLQAVQAVSGLKELMNSIPDITYKTIVIDTLSYAESVKGSYASGTSYVPETGIYQLHQGERVLNRSEIANYDQRQSKKVTINMGDIIIRGANKSPEALAKEIVRPLQIELQRLNAINN